LHFRAANELDAVSCLSAFLSLVALKILAFSGIEFAFPDAVARAHAALRHLAYIFSRNCYFHML